MNNTSLSREWDIVEKLLNEDTLGCPKKMFYIGALAILTELPIDTATINKLKEDCMEVLNG